MRHSKSAVTVTDVGLWIAAAISAAVLTWAFGFTLGQFFAAWFVLIPVMHPTKEG